MNERIRELAEQVGISVEYLTNTKQWILVEELSKLIVQECADVAGCNGHVSGFALGDLIKNRFGVKE